MKRKGKVQPVTLAFNQIRALWSKVPIRDGQPFRPELDPPELKALLMDEELKRFSRRILHLEGIAVSLLEQFSGEQLQAEIEKAEAKLRQDGTDILGP